MKLRTIRQSVFFQASPHAVYEALMDAKRHAKFSGSKAVVSRRVGGAFSVWGGWCSGKNLELVPDRKIVQAWRADMDGWPEGHFSKVSFIFKPSKNGTWLSFVHSGIPSQSAAELSQGWKDNYWEPMKKLLEE